MNVTENIRSSLFFHSGAAGEGAPPTPAVTSRGVNSCSWKVKSSIAMLFSRSGSGTDVKETQEMDGGERGARRKNEKISEKQEKGWRQLEKTLSLRLKNTCGMSVLLLHDVSPSCENTVPLEDGETQPARRTRCHRRCITDMFDSSEC